MAKSAAERMRQYRMKMSDNKKLLAKKIELIKKSFIIVGISNKKQMID